MSNNQEGKTVKGHFCIECLDTVDPAFPSKDNPYKTEFCIKCKHRLVGLETTGMVGEWLIIGKSKEKR